MNDLNDVQKKEIKLKQDKLKVLLEIDSLNVDSKEDIENYTSIEKSNLVTDIINMVGITEFDKTYFDEGYKSNCTVEGTLKFIGEHKYNNDVITQSIYDKFVYLLAYGDIDSLIDFDVLNNYLLMFNAVTFCFDDFPSDEELGIERSVGA